MLYPYTYLLINFLTVIICFIFSFHPKIKFHKQFVPFLLAAIVVGIAFIAWDVWFTKLGVWWFNDRYLMGSRLLGLPVEEWLFFLCIPFACTFTYYCLNLFFDLTWANAFANMLVFLTCVVCGVVALLYSERLYPFVTAVVTLITVIVLHFVIKVDWIGQASFVFLILMAGFFPVNGTLTGTGLDSPIVNYHSSEIIGLRILTIPIEDFAYGYTQFLFIIYFFKLFRKTKSL